MNIDDAVNDRGFVTRIQTIQKLLPDENLPGGGQERLQQRELMGRKQNRPPFQSHLVFFEIQSQLFERKNFLLVGSLRPSSPKNRLHTSDQFPGAERFYYIIICP
jgi:hypothetical protein